MKRVARAALLAVAVWLLDLSSPGAALAQQAPTPQPASQAGPEISLRPVDEAGNPLPGPGYFVITAQPGETVQLFALVSNSGAAPATVTLQAVDASTGAGGGISYNLPDQPVRDVGAWVALSQPVVTLEPGRAAVVAFQVRVPASATAGERVGGLTAFVPVPGQGSAAGQQFAVRVQTRTVAGIVVNVPGARETRLTVAGVDVEHRPDGAYLVVRMRNTGNVMSKAQGSLLVTRAGETAPLITGPIVLENTLPGTEVTFPVQWTRDPAPGRYRARVELAWEGGGTTWEEMFDVTAAVAPTPRPGAGPIVVATAEGRPGGETAGAGLGVASPSMMMGLLVGMGGLLVVAVMAIVVLLRRPRPVGP